MILPALGRITQAANINDFLAIPLWLILLLVPVVYDFRAVRKIHKATILGIALIIIGIVLTVVLIESPSWSRLLEATIGSR